MKLGVFGAGAIGTFLGGRLIHAGHDVVLVGRRGGALSEQGLELTDYSGARWQVPKERLRYVADAGALAECDAVLVTVKSAATAEAGATLARVLKPGAAVVSFQNGVANPGVLRAALPSNPVLAGMVPFNVLWRSETHLHNGTSGPLEVEKPNGDALVEALRGAGFGVVVHEDLTRVLWSKLLVNSNNAVNALSGIPLRQQLGDPGLRRVMRAVLREGLACLSAAGIRPVRIGKLVPSLAPLVLGLPNWLFMRVAAAMVKVDPEARSSMWEDLHRRRTTEVDWLNGELIRLGEKHGVPTPVNRRLVELIRAAETAGQGSPKLGAETMLG
ncbi:MAG: 2-dehydropantoate 2-reductase [Myxococcaceae bacterium]|nr:2-dehydropantoate 2-reductase [Myxococcaceae bacterium]